MNLPDTGSRVLFADLPPPEDEQFRMSRLTVYNWGTFSNVHTVHFADEGSLVLGPSGAGKSTLFDAISAMIVPPLKVHFNAAAEEGDRSGHDRTLMSYVRGAWADTADDTSSEIHKQYLRPNATWSAIALEFRNRRGRTLTLLRVFWVTSASPSVPVNKHNAVIDGEFDLVVRLRGFDGERRTLRRLLDAPEIRDYGDNFGGYQEHWSRIMGIENPAALELLHRTQSTKSLGDLNTFLRDFMLTRPATFDKARLLVEEFADLDQAHRAVVAARSQVELLAPARSALAERSGMLASRAGNDVLLDSAKAYTASVQAELLEAALERGRIDAQGLQADIDSLEQRLRDADEQLRDLDREHLALGGGDIAALTTRIDELARQREQAGRRRAAAESAARDLGWSLAADAAGFVQQVADAARITQEASDRGTTLDERRDELIAQRRDLERELEECKAEIRALEVSSSNMPRHLQDLRERLCRGTGLTPAQLPFAGELIQVREAERATWRPAAERLLRGFARMLLVEEQHQRKLARWVDETHLGLRLVYQPVPARVATSLKTLGTDSIVRKVELNEKHAFAAWVRRELTERFDYQCVDSVAELVQGDFRITAAGQIRGRAGRTEKDDRSDLKDAKGWVLGFDSREKLQTFQRVAGEVGARLADVLRDLETLERERQRDHVRLAAAGRLGALEWHEIDVLSVATRISEYEAQRGRLLESNRALHDLEGRQAQARELRSLTMQQVVTARAGLQATLERGQELGRKFDRARIEAAAISTAQSATWREQFPVDWAPSLESIARDVQDAEKRLHLENRTLNETLASADRTILDAFAAFIRRWPEESAALQADLACAADFMARLERLERDGLPGHEARFLELLRNHSLQRLVELAHHLKEAHNEINTRLEEVNDALRPIAYNPGTYLQIQVVDLHLPESREFSRRLGDLFTNQRQRGMADPDDGEAQFQRVRELVLDLQAEDKRRWRELVLDVRRHVEFRAIERERATDRQVEIHSGSAGKSGGQRQKLTATCLAAALRYQLGGSDGGVPQYAPVLLDEAFTKTDSDFTATSMRIFKELGFQMIIATPVKSVMTLEEFVGGAVYVSIADRRQSAVRHIDYETRTRRLAWTDEQRAEALEADAHA